MPKWLSWLLDVTGQQIIGALLGSAFFTALLNTGVRSIRILPWEWAWVLWTGTPLVAFVVLVRFLARAEGRGHNSLTIHSARYGVGGGKYADVRPIVRGHIASGRIDLKVENQVLHGDPYPNEPKHLIVVYSIDNGPRRERTALEHHVLRIPDDGDDRTMAAQALNVELEVARKILRDVSTQFRKFEEKDLLEETGKFGFRYVRVKEFIAEAFRPHVKADIEARERIQRAKGKSSVANIQEFARCLDEWASKLAANDIDPDYAPASLASLLTPRA